MIISRNMRDSKSLNFHIFKLALLTWKTQCGKFSIFLLSLVKSIMEGNKVQKIHFCNFRDSGTKFQPSEGAKYYVTQNSEPPNVLKGQFLDL